ncbi:hypothetical protein GOV03_04240 [Candidatus Woesearchaeota archaeon]|nr:hypothetical protein [Candidatus Woesearchaeota archaeon]
MNSLNLQLEQAVSKIREKNPKTILVQLPDGLKPQAREIQKELQQHTDAQIYLWLNSCYGACDIPKVENIDLLLQFGHSKWK